MIDRILGSGRHRQEAEPTAKRIFERLRDEYGFEGQHTIVKDYVRGSADGRPRTQPANPTPGIMASYYLRVAQTVCFRTN